MKKRETLPLFSLLHIQDQALEIFPLGMIDVDGVVGWLGELVENLDPAARVCGCGEHRLAEQFFCHDLGA